MYCHPKKTLHMNYQSLTKFTIVTKVVSLLPSGFVVIGESVLKQIAPHGCTAYARNAHCRLVTLKLV